jgi:hypothetical protein
MGYMKLIEIIWIYHGFSRILENVDVSIQIWDESVDENKGNM